MADNSAIQKSKGTKMTSKIKVLVSADMIFLLLLALSGSTEGTVSTLLYYSAFIIPSIMMLSFTYRPHESLHASASFSKNDIARDIKRDFTLSKKGLFFTLPILFPSILLILAISLLISLLLGALGMENTTVSSSSFVSALVTYALLPAILEELLFRFSTIKLLGENKKTALLLSSLMFAFAHANLFQIPYALAAGFICGALYLVTGSILPSIILHFINNTVSLLSMYGYGDTNIIITLCALTLISLVFLIIYRRFFINAIKSCFDKKKMEISYHPIVFIITSLVLAISMLFV